MLTHLCTPDKNPNFDGAFLRKTSILLKFSSLMVMCDICQLCRYRDLFRVLYSMLLYFCKRKLNIILLFIFLYVLE